jgi:hypothetical protein
MQPKKPWNAENTGYQLKGEQALCNFNKFNNNWKLVLT